MKRVAKVINLGALRWLRSVISGMPKGNSVRAASLQMQKDEIDFFQDKLDQYNKKKEQEPH